MLIIDNKKNIYEVHLYNDYGIDWIEDFLNVGNCNTVGLTYGYEAYECDTDIKAVIDYMNDYLHNEGDFIDDEDDKENAYFIVRIYQCF